MHTKNRSTLVALALTVTLILAPSALAAPQGVAFELPSFQGWFVTLLDWIGWEAATEKAGPFAEPHGTSVAGDTAFGPFADPISGESTPIDEDPPAAGPFAEPSG